MRSKYSNFLRMFIFFTLVGIILWFLYQVRIILLPFGLGFTIAYILNPVVDLFEKKMSRVYAILLVYVILLTLAIFFLLFVFPTLLRDVNRLIELIPQYAQTIQQTLLEIQIGYNRVALPESLRVVIDGILQQFVNGALAISEGLILTLLNLFSQAFYFIIAPVLSFYFLFEFHSLGAYILKSVPARFRTEITEIGEEINLVFHKFLKGYLFIAVIVGVLTTVGMYLIGMDFPVLLGVVVGLTNFIPYFGAIISAFFAVLLALIKSKWLALYVLGLMFLIQQIEGSIISPKILGDCVGLHPLIIIFALLVSGQLWGILGLLIAVPLAAVLKIFWKHIYHHLI